MAEPGGDTAASTDESERKKRTALAETIERRLLDIERRWLEKVEETIADRRQGATVSDLRDAIGEYLLGLSEALRGEQSLETSATAAWSVVAREHALTRVRLGFDIDQLVREFIFLRQILFEVAREEQLITNDLQCERLADLIDAAIAESVKSYVDSRDLAARRQQAEHIGFLTHELRNPLSTATMVANLLRKRPEIAASQGEKLDMLDRSLQRIRAQIDGILLTQRLDAGEVECRPVDTTLGKIMVDAIRAAELEARQKEIALITHYDPELAICVDPGLTTSALQNVVDNAVKFTDRGRIEITADDNPSEVLIHVYDNCDGLSGEELKTIFEPFKRAHSGKAGTGLGLSIARRALEAQGGQIGAEPSGERGCHFWLTLPKPRH
jgi:signal transduction histidine kinase